MTISLEVVTLYSSKASKQEKKKEKSTLSQTKMIFENGPTDHKLISQWNNSDIKWN